MVVVVAELVVIVVPMPKLTGLIALAVASDLPRFPRDQLSSTKRRRE